MITTLPNLAASFALMKLQDTLHTIRHHSVQAQVWRDADPRQVKTVAKEIHDQLQDNRVLVVDMLGPDIVLLVDKIFEK